MYTPSWVAAILDSASKVLPLVVAVSGRVGSDTPLICQQSGMRGVIVEEAVSTDFLFHHIIIFYWSRKGALAQQ
jgi:E3 ubiquitin-protein ligase MUL1